MESCLYSGTVEHRRLRPVEHAFEQRLTLAYLDLDELSDAFADTRWWALERRAPVAFHRSDYFGDPSVGLADAVRDEVARHSGHRPDGPVRMLASLRHFGLCFNPVSFYYCFDAAGERVDALLADVTNTPWKERHAYVLHRAEGDGASRVQRFDIAKQFHVSPFMGMEQRYRWSVSEPGDELRLGIASREEEAPIFAASLRLERRAWSARNRARAALAHPWSTVQVLAGIYWQALRLYWKRAPYFPHPDPVREPGRAVVHE